jgi:hypothetical protein|tara:strand:- start:1472 stop:2041 length:570 start_codon:yes stop_codon:yes gene_type:complete
MKEDLYNRLKRKEIIYKIYRKEISKSVRIEDLKSRQKALIKNYSRDISKQNSNSHKPHTYKVLELDRDGGGIWRYLPRRKNSKYAQKVKKQKEFTSSIDYLEGKGFFIPDNFFMGAVYGGVILIGAFSGLAYLNDMEILETISQTWKLDTAFSICMGIVAQKKRQNNHNKMLRSIQEARYLDEITEELS